MGKVLQFPQQPGKDTKCTCGAEGPRFEVMLVGQAFPVSLYVEATFYCPGCGVERVHKLKGKV